MELCRNTSIFVTVLYFLGVAGAHAEIENKVVIAGENITLSCHANTSKVIWLRSVILDYYPTLISTCHLSDLGCEYIGGQSDNCRATYDGLVSELMCIAPRETIPFYKCESEPGNTLYSYNVTIINQIIQSPKCSIFPIFRIEDTRNLNFTCKSTVLQGIESYLEIFVHGKKELTSQAESSSIVVNEDNFIHMFDASCKMYFQESNTHRICYFPSAVNIYYRLAGNDAVFECDNSSTLGQQISWRLLDVNGDVDIENRSWTRNGGRSMLLREITNDDVQRIVECKIYSTENPTFLTAVGFFTIVDIHSTNPTTTMATGTTVATSPGNKDDKLYRGLTILFILLEAITISLIIANVVYIKRRTARERVVKNKSAKEMQGTSRSSGDGIALSNAECNENNSASGNSIERQRKNDSEDGTLEATNLQVGMTGMDNPVYFCVERSTPSMHRSFVGTGLLDSEDDDDSNVDQDSTGYDLVRIPMRTSVADTEHVKGPNNDEYAVVQRNVKRAKEKSIEDISQLYGKIKK